MQLLQVFHDYNCRHVKASDTECLNLVPYRMKWLWWRNWSRISSKTESWHLRKCQSRDCWSAGQASCRHQGEGARSGFVTHFWQCHPFYSPRLLSPQYLRQEEVKTWDGSNLLISITYDLFKARGCQQHWLKSLFSAVSCLLLWWSGCGGLTLKSNSPRISIFRRKRGKPWKIIAWFLLTTANIYQSNTFNLIINQHEICS